jgi:hypothetical protein
VPKPEPLDQYQHYFFNTDAESHNIEVVPQN